PPADPGESPPTRVAVAPSSHRSLAVLRWTSVLLFGGSSFAADSLIGHDWSETHPGRLKSLELASLHCLPVAGYFGAVAASAHVAPLAALVTAGVVEKPVAIVGGADAQAAEVMGGQQVGRGQGDGPERALGMRVGVPGPGEAVRGHRQAGMTERRDLLAGEQVEIALVGVAASGDRAGNAEDRLAQRHGAGVNRLSLERPLLSPEQERIDGAGIEQAGLMSEGDQVGVTGQLVDDVRAAAGVDRVGEIEAQVGRIEAENRG